MPRRVSDIPSALKSPDKFHDAFARRLAGKRLAVFLDYDGTLTPIAESPDKAVLSEAMRENLRSLAKRCVVAIVSGRDLDGVRRLVGLDDLIYAGNHGFNISGPDGCKIHHEKGVEFHDLMAEVEAELDRKLEAVEGLLIENKKSSVVAHYRLVCEADQPKVSEAVQNILQGHPELRLAPGKMIHEIQPRLDWNKGKAVLWLLEALGLDCEDVAPIYIGDDTTDEDAFKAIDGRGIGVFVGDKAKRNTSAHFKVKNPDEVGLLLQILV